MRGAMQRHTVGSRPGGDHGRPMNPAGHTSRPRRRRIPSALAAAALVLGVAACGSSSSSHSSPGGKTSAAKASGSGGVVHLTFWSWVPGIAKQVALFNATHKNIQVSLTKTPTGTQGTYAKMFAAIKAGDPPDVGQIEFNVLPSFVSTGGIRNLAKDGASQYANQFTPTAWQQVSFGGGVWAIPQATGPTALFYNAALFKKYGLAVPTTWSQFASEAMSLHKAHPGVYMTNFDTDPSWLAMLAWQAGGRWFTQSGNAWKLGFTDAGSMRAASYWEKLIAAHAVLAEPSFNAGWYQQFAKGKLLTWPTAQWGTTIMTDNVASGAGKWRVAPMPQWSPGAHVYAQYGGSTTAVFKATSHPKQALEFALWMNTNTKAVQAGVVAGFGWPAAKSGLSAPALNQPLSYFGPKNFYPIFRTAQADTAPGWSYGPDYATVINQMGDVFNGVASGSTTLQQMLAKVQQKQTASLKSSGINVAQ